MVANVTALAGKDELHRARAILSHVGEQREGVAGGDLELPCPSFEDVGVVRQESLQERTHHGVAMLPLRKRHGQGDRKGVVSSLP